MRWKSEQGQSYQLQTSPSLDAATWLNEGAIVEGTGETMEQSIGPMTEAMRFYRLITR